MHDPEGHFDLLRCLALASRWELHDLVTELSGLSTVDVDHRRAGIRAGSERLLREIAIRRAALHPTLLENCEKWARISPLLTSLERMSRDEIERLEELARCARDRTRAWVATLPAAWQERCRSLVASSILPDDVETLGVTNTVRQLRRQLTVSLWAFGRRAALLIHHELLVRLAAATDTAYSLACTADQILRAIEHMGDIDHTRLGISSLADRLAARREHWLSQAAQTITEDVPDIETALEVGALATAMGFEIALRALETLDVTELQQQSTDADGRRLELRQGVLAAVRTALDREWVSSARDGLPALDAYVTGRFVILQCDIDDWLEALRTQLGQQIGHSTDDTHQLEAFHFELLDICRRAQAGDRPKEST